VHNRSQTVELLLDYMLLRRRRRCLPPSIPCKLAEYRICMLQYLPYSKNVFVMHVTVSIEFRFPFRDLKNLFSCMLQSPHTLFISLHFENVRGLIFAHFLGHRNRKFLLREETEDSFRNSFSLRERELLREETKDSFQTLFSCEKESFRYLFER
jgi:hypothetical protein